MLEEDRAYKNFPNDKIQIGTITVTGGSSIECENKWSAKQLEQSRTKMTFDPEEVVTFGFNYEISNPTFCPGCVHYTVVGIGNEPSYCNGIGIPPTCPSSDFENSSGSITAPSGPGTYPVYAYDAWKLSCSEADRAYKDFPNDKIQIGTITLRVFFRVNVTNI